MFKKSKVIFISVLMLLSGGLFVSAAQAAVQLESIRLFNGPYGLSFTLNGKPPYRIHQTGKREIMIAFRDITLPSRIRKIGSGAPLIRKISAKMRPDGTIIIYVTTTMDVKNVRTQWMSARNTLEIVLQPAVVYAKKSKKSMKYLTKKGASGKPGIGPRSMAKKTDIAPGDIKSSRFTKTARKGNAESIRYKSVKGAKPVELELDGGLDDLLGAVAGMQCAKDSNTIESALSYCEKEMWQDAAYILSSDLESNPDMECRDSALYLKAFCEFQTYFKIDKTKHVTLTELFNDALINDLKSPLRAYGLAAIAKIYADMGSTGGAIAYTDLILQNHKNYSGKPELLLDLGRVYKNKNKLDKARASFLEVIKVRPKTAYAMDARIDLGKTAYAAKNWDESQRFFSEVVRLNPHAVFEHQDILEFIGNSHYQQEEYTDARKALIKSYNFFPEKTNGDLILTRIADTYKDQDNSEKAAMMYYLVTGKYPSTDGFVISTMRLAALKGKSEMKQKNDLFDMVISDYGDHTMAKFAMLKLADLQNKITQHEKSIATIAEFKIRFPKALANEAAVIKQSAYRALYELYLKKKEYTRIMTRYEREKEIFEEFKDPAIFFTVSKAFLHGHLYDKASELLARTDLLYGRRDKPAELTYYLGLASQKAGKNELAEKHLTAYLRKNRNKSKASEAYFSRGIIYLAAKQYKRANKDFESALKRTKKNNSRAEIYLSMSKAYKGRKEYSMVAESLIKHLEIVNLDKTRYNEDIYLAYRELGGTYIQLNSYIKAAEAFSSALEIASNDVNPVDVRFSLGESYQKGNKMDMALRVYKKIIDSDDPFWKKLAEEKVRGIELEAKLRQS